MSSTCDHHPVLTKMQRVSLPLLARPKPTAGSIDQLPNELVDSILSRFDVQVLIHLRLVCKRWQNVIENINFNKQKSSLVLMDYAQTATFREALTRRFFGEIDWSTFVYLKLKRTRDPEAVEHFRALLLRLFPIISQLVISFWFVSDPEFVFNLWPSDQLTTLSFNLNGTLTRRRMEQLFPRMITSFTHLKRLALDLFYEMLSTLAPNLTSLEHLSCSYGSHGLCSGLLADYINHMKCTRLWNQSLKANYFEIIEWHRIPGGWLNGLTHLALFINSSAAQVIDYLSARASNLRVSHLKHNVTNHNIFTLNSTTVRNLSRLVHLAELELDWVAVNMSDMELAVQERQLASLNHIRICRITIYRIEGNNREANCSDRLMRLTLSMIVPNVEQLTTGYYSADQLANIELYLRDGFAHLRSHEFVHRMIRQ